MTKQRGHAKRVLEIPPDQRLEALARIQAIEAQQREDVIAFREEVLANRLLRHEETSAWLLERWKKDGVSKTFSWLQLPPGVSLSMGEWWEAACHISQISREGLNFLAVREDGVLGRLKRVAEGLTKAFTWNEGEAVAFVLTGAIPTLCTSRVTVHLLAPELNVIRIFMDLDPQTRVADVATLFREARRHMSFGQVKVFRRYRPISPKHGQLAVFLAETPGLTWQKRMDAWNKQAPERMEVLNEQDPKHVRTSNERIAKPKTGTTEQEHAGFWRYTDCPQFRREAVAAYKRVTGKTWKQVRV